MHNGWIKLHRKTLDNKIFKHDLYAWRVFETLLMLADRETGQWTGGRIQLGANAGLKPITAYMASIRLVKANLITLSSNNKFSTFSICKWKEYQALGNSVDNNAVTTRYHSNKKGRIKNIRKYIKENKTPNTKQLKVGLSFIESIRKQIKDKKG